MKISNVKGLIPMGILEKPISKALIQEKAEQEVSFLLKERTPLEVYVASHVIASYADAMLGNIKTFATEQAVSLVGDKKSYDMPNGVRVTVATTLNSEYNFESHAEWLTAKNEIEALEMQLKIAKSKLKAIELTIASSERPKSVNETKTLKLSY